MKIFLNGLLFWIIINSYSDGNESNSKKEEVDFYESLRESYNDDPKAFRRNSHRDKRAGLQDLTSKGGVYESEVKVLGRVDGETKKRVEREIGDSDFSISEIPIYPNSSHQDPSLSEHRGDDSSTEVSVVDSSISKDIPNRTLDDTTEDSSSSDGKTTDDELHDIGTGIEIESEEKLADDDSSERQSSSQSTETEIAVTSRSETMEQVLWPSGTYGLPKAVSGCPGSSGFKWSSGRRFYDTEDDGTENHNSVAFHLAADITEDGITLEFCIKTKDVGVTSWPSGKYCVYKKGDVCPNGLKSGFVYWDDENRENKNFFDGTLPEGTYTEKTKIVFCCSTSGNVTSEIILPTEKPFYLFPYGSTTCQKVKKMKSMLEFVKFDEEDQGDIEKSAGGFYPYGIRPQEKDHTFNLCYYWLQDEDDLPSVSLSQRISQPEKLAHSEQVIHEFMKSKEPSDMDEIAKEQVSRTRNGKKFQGMQTSTYHAIMIATGFVLTTVGILVGALLVISYFTKRWSRDLKRGRNTPSNATKESNTQPEQVKPQQQERVRRETIHEQTERCDEVDFVETETEQEDEELVEDQFLPSDSQLKSGLEFLFLKQQKRKWLAKKSRNK